MKVKLANKLPQTVAVSMLDAEGKLVEVRIDPHCESAALDDDKLTPHARQLVAAGRLKLRPA